MKKRILGRTGMEISEIAFGGVSIGMPYAGQPMPPESESIRILHRALEQGINFYDTARMYGVSEQLIGKAFKDRRDEVIINTKCVHFLDPSGKIPSDIDLERTIHESLEKSMKTLGTDYIDVYMLHQSSMDILTNDEVAGIFTNLKKQGKVRAIGASTYTLEESRTCIDAGIWDVIQLPFNLMDQQQSTFFSRTRELGIGLIIRSVLFRGMLTDKPLNLRPELQEVADHIRNFQELIGRDIPDLVTLAMKFVLSYDAVGSVLVGMDRMEHLHAALEVADGSYFDEELMSKLENLAYPDPGFLNLSHWVKNGWLEN